MRRHELLWSALVCFAVAILLALVLAVDAQEPTFDSVIVTKGNLPTTPQEPLKPAAFGDFTSEQIRQSGAIPPRATLVDFTCKIVRVSGGMVYLHCVDRAEVRSDLIFFISQDKWPAAWPREFAKGVTFLAQMTKGRFIPIEPSKTSNALEPCKTLDECHNGERHPANKCLCPADMRNKGLKSGQ